MGRGLAAILPEGSTDYAQPSLREVPVGLIDANPSQPRKFFDPIALTALAESIATEGVIQPLVLQPKPGGRFELVAGERRWRASTAAGLATVPAIVREASEAERLRTALVENMVREDLNAVEEARACALLVEDMGMNKESLARSLGRSRSAVSNLIRILDLPDEVLDLVESGELSEGHGRAILRNPDNEGRRRLGLLAADQGLSVREVEGRARAAAEAAESATSAVSGPKGPLSADERAAIGRAAEALTAAMRTDVRFRKSGSGYVAELRFSEPSEAEELAALLRRG